MKLISIVTPCYNEEGMRELSRGAFAGDNETLLFSTLLSLPNDQILSALNSRFFLANDMGSCHSPQR